jgi:transposase
MFALGVPSYRQRFRSGTSAPSRERFYRLARACCAYVENLREPFEGSVECDETTFGGARPGRRGWGAGGKVIVFGIVKRNGEVKALPIAAHSGAEVWREIVLHTKPGSLYYTDDWHAYASLRLRGEHVVIRKERGRPKGRDTINGIEGFRSYAKNWRYPFRGVPRKYFHLYLGEVCFRFNHRSRNLKPLLMRLMKRLSIGEIDPILVRKA